ncbi:MAG: hypothetical protein FWC08_13605 [Defluviitaleaceae bacterium]|nr:hypothetical protein [Defluviitaleaceae bacterium]
MIDVISEIAIGVLTAAVLTILPWIYARYRGQIILVRRIAPNDKKRISQNARNFYLQLGCSIVLLCISTGLYVSRSIGFEWDTEGVMYRVFSIGINEPFMFVMLGLMSLSGACATYHMKSIEDKRENERSKNIDNNSYADSAGNIYVRTTPVNDKDSSNKCQQDG